MINNKTDIIGYMQLFFKFWPIGSPEEAYYMEYKCDFTKPLNEDFFKYILGSFGKICEEQDEKKRIFEGKYIDYETYASECLADAENFNTKKGLCKKQLLVLYTIPCSIDPDLNRGFLYQGLLPLQYPCFSLIIYLFRHGFNTNGTVTRIF